MSLVMLAGAEAQDKSAKAFEKLVAGNEPLFVDGERVYRPKEVSQTAIVTSKPEPMFTDKARKKKTHGTVEMRAVFKSTGELKSGFSESFIRKSRTLGSLSPAPFISPLCRFN